MWPVSLAHLYRRIAQALTTYTTISSREWIRRDNLTPTEVSGSTNVVFIQPFVVSAFTVHVSLSRNDRDYTNVSISILGIMIPGEHNFLQDPILHHHHARSRRTPAHEVGLVLYSCSRLVRLTAGERPMKAPAAWIESFLYNL